MDYVSLARRFAPYLGGAVAAICAGWWLFSVLSERQALRDWQQTVLVELTVATGVPDRNGKVVMVKPADAAARIRNLGSYAATLRGALETCNDAATKYADARDRALAAARKLVEEGKRARQEREGLRAELAADRATGPICLPTVVARKAWGRLTR